MDISVETLPTHIAQLYRRAGNLEPTSGDYFLVKSYIFELALKNTVISLQTILSELSDNPASETHSNRLGSEIVRANSLGNWQKILNEATSQKVYGLYPTETLNVIEWLTKSRNNNEKFIQAFEKANEVLGIVKVSQSDDPRKPKITDLINRHIRIRNKTKAHGAVGPDFFKKANEIYSDSVDYFVASSPLITETKYWYVRPERNYEVSCLTLKGLMPEESQDFSSDLTHRHEGVWISICDASPAKIDNNLFSTNREIDKFFVPNGHLKKEKKTAEFIDYKNAETKQVSVGDFAREPVPPPKSETAGEDSLSVYHHSFSNLPPYPEDYTKRKNLEKDLKKRLRDRNHPIITLHGRGGIGKTSLALKVAHEFANSQNNRFEHILWFSARDLDLRSKGPVAVKPEVINLGTIINKYNNIMNKNFDKELFALNLHEKADDNSHLLILDNFETFQKPMEVYNFFNEHTHPSNKVLITTRERRFKADYPIEVKGMKLRQSNKLIRSRARKLSCEGILDEEKIESIHEQTQGHPYLMKILVGEIDKVGAGCKLKVNHPMAYSVQYKRRA